MTGAGCSVERENVKGVTGQAGLVSNGPTAVSDCTTTDGSTARLLPTERRNVAVGMSADGQHPQSQHDDLDVWRQLNYAGEPSPCITNASCSAAAAAITTTTTSSSSALLPPPSSHSSYSRNIAEVIQMPVTGESSSSSSYLFNSEAVRRSTSAEASPSVVSKSSLTGRGGGGTAVARLLGTSAVQVGVCGPAPSGSPRGRRSLHHSWVRPGRSAAFSEMEPASKTVTPALYTPHATAAAAMTTTTVTAATTDDTHASNHL